MIDTWTCHICGEERPDDRISVRKHDRSEENELPPGAFVENVRYCNDREACIEDSKTHSHFKKDEVQKKMKENLEYISKFSMVNRPNKKDNNIMKYIYTFLIFFVAVMILNPFLATLLQDDVTFMEKLLYPTGIFLRVLIASYFSWRYADKIFKKQRDGRK